MAGEGQDVAAEMAFVGVACIGILLPLTPPYHYLGCEVFNLQAARIFVARRLSFGFGEHLVEAVAGFLPGGKGRSFLFS
jgi:hypothetical protein